MKKGKFIVFEGLDGSGQSTQAQLLENHLKEKGIDAHLTKEPTDNLIGGLIRGRLKGEWETGPECLQLLFTADRAHHLEKEIIPLLEKGVWVICDRYFFSTIAFGSLEIDNFEWLKTLNERFLLPDRGFFLEVSPKECVRRIKGNRFTFELFEKEKKLEGIKKGYERAVKDYDPLLKVDGERSQEEVFSDIKKRISEEFNI